MRFLIAFISLAFPAFAEPPDRTCNSGNLGHNICVRYEHFAFDTCQAIRDTSAQHQLDPHFFTRLIWQESRFDPNALSPVGAQGIAQFMPGTAKLRNLTNAFNPALALDHSAHYLAELVKKFGNVGLAAVAYNGGESRATNFIAKTGGLAVETINYVKIITGQSAEDWRDTPDIKPDLQLDKTKTFMNACLHLAKSRTSTKPKSLNPEPQVKPWGMQMASGSSRSKAKASFKRNSRTCRAQLGKTRPDYIKKVPQVAGRQVYYVARVSFNTRGAAQKMCNRIRKFKCVCAVYKN